jgi:hypothetical protein
MAGETPTKPDNAQYGTEAFGWVALRPRLRHMKIKVLIQCQATSFGIPLTSRTLTILCSLDYFLARQHIWLKPRFNV